MDYYCVKDKNLCDSQRFLGGWIMEGFFWLLGIAIWGIIWGFATNAVISNRGYDENWFWWGFFFGFIAFIVACTKPQNSSSYDERRIASQEEDRRRLRNGGWKCKCGRVNPAYTGTCACGRTQQSVRAENLAQITAREQARTQEAQATKDAAELTNLQKLKEYKSLLDLGIITQEEFDKKKAEILG